MFQTVEILFSTKQIPNFHHKYVWLVYPSICTTDWCWYCSYNQYDSNRSKHSENEEEKTTNFSAATSCQVICSWHHGWLPFCGGNYRIPPICTTWPLFFCWLQISKDYNLYSTMFKPADDLLKVHMQFAYRSCLFTLPSTTLFMVTSYQVVKDLCFMTLELWKWSAENFTSKFQFPSEELPQLFFHQSCHCMTDLCFTRHVLIPVMDTNICILQMQIRVNMLVWWAKTVKFWN
jgi:hypothetical protein